MFTSSCCSRKVHVEDKKFTNLWTLFMIWQHCHRIDTRPEGTLLCVLAEGKRPKFFYVLWRHPGVHTALCTYVFLWKTSVCTPGWRHMMSYFHVSTRKISDKMSSEWHFWSCIYSVTLCGFIVLPLCWSKISSSDRNAYWSMAAIGQWCF
jgi:hypothetical protein